MKPHLKPASFLLISCLLFTLSCNFCSISAKSNKLALIVAVANYPAEGGWAAISSDKDIPLIKSTLLKQGFKEDNIEVIIDEEAKYNGLVNALNNLIDKAQEGDVVVFHYSGHGQQIRDNNEDEVDGYDEAIVPYDAHMRFKKDVYTGQFHLRDDEFGGLLTQLREKVGDKGDVLVIIDACHSGTGTRGFGKSRGTDVKFAEPGYLPELKDGIEEGFFEKAGGTRGGSEPADLAPMVVISGASAEELNYEYTDDEGNSYGSLSYAISRVFNKAPKNSTYRGAFDMIKMEMSVIAPKQTPQIEGDLDKGIFGGQAVEQVPYFLVKEWIDNKTLILDAGNLMGIYDNTVVELYPINTPDPSKAKPIAKGTVANSSAIECDLLLETDLTDEQAKNTWVFIKKQNFGDMRAKLKIIKNENKKYVGELTEVINNLATIELTDNNADLFVEVGKTNIVITTNDDVEIYKSDINSGNTDKTIREAADAAKSFAQVNLLRNLEISDRTYYVFFEIIPITVKKSGSRFVEDQRLSLEDKMVNGNIVFNEGDCFKIKVTNDGYEPAYYQILDIQADNNVGLLVPAANKTANEYKIYPGESIELRDIFIFGEPYGKEIFKLIATENALNLSGIISTRGSGTRGSMSQLEMLFAESFAQTRAASLSVPPGSANIHSQVIIVKQDK